MAHFRSFFRKLGYALQYTDAQCTVCKGDAKELAFEPAVFLFVFFRFLLPFPQLLPFPLAVALFHPLVVFGVEVLGADILRAVRVFPEVSQEFYHITPHRAVCNGVAVADADFY